MLAILRLRAFRCGSIERIIRTSNAIHANPRSIGHELAYSTHAILRCIERPMKTNLKLYNTRPGETHAMQELAVISEQR